MRGEWIRKPTGIISVVFVHGILSSGEKCWEHPNGAYWPELLKNEPELENVGIYVYSYQTGFTSGSYSLSDVVDDLKERVFKLDRVADSQKIVFVCHSMGGIVVRKFIVERSLDFLKLNIEIGLYLVASPSLGSSYANWIEPIAIFAGNLQAQALRFSADNQWLNDLDKDFTKLIRDDNGLKIYGKELVEDKFVRLKFSWFSIKSLRYLFQKQVVQSFSAARYFGDSYKVPDSDHFSIAKPQDQKSDQHRLLKLFIQQDYESSNSLIDDSKSREDDTNSLKLLMKFMPFSQLLNYVNTLPISTHIDLFIVGDTFYGFRIDNPHRYPFNDRSLNSKFDSFINSYNELCYLIHGYTDVEGRQQANFTQANQNFQISMEKRYIPHEKIVELTLKIEQSKTNFIYFYMELINYLRENYSTVDLGSYNA